MPQSQQSVPITIVAVCGAQIAPPYDDDRVWPLASAQDPLWVAVVVGEVDVAGAGEVVDVDDDVGVGAVDVGVDEDVVLDVVLPPHARSFALGA